MVGQLFAGVLCITWMEQEGTSIKEAFCVNKLKMSAVNKEGTEVVH